MAFSILKKSADDIYSLVFCWTKIIVKIKIFQAAQIQPSSVIKTEYSTFTYFITSLDGSQTVTSTDIVVSSNVVTETVQPTPFLEPSQLASSNYVSIFGMIT